MTPKDAGDPHHEREGSMGRQLGRETLVIGTVMALEDVAVWIRPASDCRPQATALGRGPLLFQPEEHKLGSGWAVVDRLIPTGAGCGESGNFWWTTARPWPHGGWQSKGSPMPAARKHTFSPCGWRA